MRFFISMIQEEPYVYIVTKIKNTSPKGIIAITVKQDRYDEFEDYVDNDPFSETYGDMFANYYSSTVEPKEKLKNEFSLSVEAKTYSVRIGGSKVLYAKVLDSNGVDITNEFDSSKLQWSVISKDNNIPVKDLIVFDKSYTTKEENKFKCKFKFKGDEHYLNNVLTVTAKLGNLVSNADLDIVS